MKRKKRLQLAHFSISPPERSINDTIIFKSRAPAATARHWRVVSVATHAGKRTGARAWPALGADIQGDSTRTIAGYHGSSNTATLFDSTTGSGTKIGTLDTTSAVGTLNYDVGFTNGLTIVTATGTNADITVSYK